MVLQLTDFEVGSKLIANIATVKNEAQFSFLVHVWKTVASSGTPEQLSSRKASIVCKGRVRLVLSLRHFRGFAQCGLPRLTC